MEGNYCWVLRNSERAGRPPILGVGAVAVKTAYKNGGGKTSATTKSSDSKVASKASTEKGGVGTRTRPER